jgi:hypothetical protein
VLERNRFCRRRTRIWGREKSVQFADPIDAIGCLAVWLAGVVIGTDCWWRCAASSRSTCWLDQQFRTLSAFGTQWCRPGQPAAGLIEANFFATATKHPLFLFPILLLLLLLLLLFFSLLLYFARPFSTFLLRIIGKTSAGNHAKNYQSSSGIVYVPL